MIATSLISFFLHSFTPQLHAGVLYEMKDLEVLERDKTFEEFLLHVNDIRPSERDKHWREMYQSMAMGLIDYKIKIKDFSLESYRAIEQMARSSALRNDEFFQLKRTHYAKKYFTECFKKANKISENVSLCESELSSFWFFTKKDPDLGLELAAILEQNDSTVKLWPYYAPAIKDNMANFYCQKPVVQSAVLNKLYEESFSKEFDGNYKTMLERVISANCFDALVKPLKDTLSSPKSSGLDKEMALSLLEAKNKLTKDEQDLYAILYLLDGPVVGDKMNLAWKKVENLNDNFQKRQKLLEEIQKLPLIPDKIFKDPAMPRNKAIINLFAKHFPEYLNYYGSTCLKYIQNKSDIPLNISSSLQCNEFLKAAKAERDADVNPSSPWLSDSVQSQYSGLKK